MTKLEPVKKWQTQTADSIIADIKRAKESLTPIGKFISLEIGESIINSPGECFVETIDINVAQNAALLVKELKSARMGGVKHMARDIVDYDFKLFRKPCLVCGMKGKHSPDCAVNDAYDLLERSK